MRKVYLINDAVIFDADAGLLIEKDNDTVKLSLNKPISRCLNLLIERKSEIVSQDDIFEYVWRAHGAKINANTYYQNISILRRMLSQMGLGEEVIKTVSRKGVMLSQSIDVVCLSHPEEYTEAVSAATLSHDEPVPEENPKYAASISFIQFVKNNKLIIYFISFLFVFFLSLSLFARYFGVTNTTYKENDLENYRYVGDVDYCHVYSNLLIDLQEILLFSFG